MLRCCHAADIDMPLRYADADIGICHMLCLLSRCYYAVSVAFAAMPRHFDIDMPLLRYAMPRYAFR